MRLDAGAHISADRRAVDLYEGGVTIAAAVRRRHKTPEAWQTAIERAVLRMLST